MTTAKKTAAKAVTEQDQPKADAAVVADEPEQRSEQEEIAARSQDVREGASDEHRKVFVVQKNPTGADYDDDMHARNIDAMRHAMILQGLRPTEDGRFVGADEHPDGQSVCLTYAAKCVPAATATPEENTVWVTVEDQHTKGGLVDAEDTTTKQ